MTDVNAGAATPADEPTFLGHPRGLVTLFFTEMWERFSFYGMRALLVIYLTQHFLFSDEKAQGLYGAYAALVYLMPVIGGVIADRFLGARKAVTIGAVLLVLGHFGMAFEGSGSRQYLDVGGESYLVTAEGRGETRQLYIDLPSGRHHLRFEVERRLMLLNDAQGSLGFEPAETPPSDPAEMAQWRTENAGRYQLISETPSFIYTFCSTVGFQCGNPPATQLSVVGQGEYPVRAVGDDSVVDFGGHTYTLAETSTSHAVAFDPAATEGAEATVVRDIPENLYESRVEQEPLYVQILFFSLALIIMGVGFLKANISTTVGALYAEGDPRRDGGFTIFYMGINLGSFFATLLCGWLGQTYGWSYGFGLAGVGMLAGLAQYLTGQKWLKGKADPPKPISAAFEGFFWMVGLIAVIPAWLLVQQSELMEQALPVFVPLLFLAVLVFALMGFKGLERGRLVAALVMTFFSVVFWMLFEQAGSSLSLFAERSTDLTVVPGVTMTAAQTQSFNAGFIVLLALPFSAMWIWLAKRKMEPSTPVKFALGLIQVGLGFFILVLGAQPELSGGGGGDYRVPLIFLALLYLLHTTGELFLSPVGLSMITKLSPVRVVGLMMGVWFLSSSLAHILAAIIAQRTASETIGGEVVDPAAQLETYVQVFTSVGVVGIAAGVLLWLLSPIVKRWIGPPV